MAAWQRSGWLKGVGIPAPTGSYEVGCVDLMHRLEGDSDGLLVRLFYPTDPGLAGRGYQYAKTTPDNQYLRETLRSFFQIQFSGLIAGVLKPFVDVRGPALYGAPLVSHSYGGTSPSFTSFPVVVFSHGLVSMRTVYTALSCELASHGYMLACVEHRDRSACTTVRKVPKPGAPGEYKDEWIPLFPAGKPAVKNPQQFQARKQQVQQRVDEVGKTLDLLQLLNEGGAVLNMMGERFDWGQFRGRLQLDTAAVMGHSFGGTTTVKTMFSDKRFKCGIALDSWMLPLDEEQLEEELDKPLLFINSDFDFQWPAAISKMMKLVKEPDEHGVSKCQILTLKGSNHLQQCDLYFTTPSSSMPPAYRSPQLDPCKSHQVNANICLAFLQRFLIQDPDYQQGVPNLDGGEGASEHILFGTNIDWKNGPDEGGLAHLW